MPKAISLASKSSPPRCWRPETGKKLAGRGIRTSAPPNSGASPSRSRLGLRDPHLLAEIRREAALMSQHPENAAIDEWIEAVYDWSGWKGMARWRLHPRVC